MRAYCYRITIAGELSEADREDLADFRIECHGTNTVLVDDLDQADVFGILFRIGALGLELVGLERSSERMA